MNKMENEFVTYDQALALYELGYKENVLKVYSIRWKKLLDEEYANRYGVDYILSPLRQQVFNWFRYKYNLLCFIDFYDNSKYDYVIRNHRISKERNFNDGPFTMYRIAENALINRLIELAKEIEK
jgi:hypothetical protein